MPSIRAGTLPAATSKTNLSQFSVWRLCRQTCASTAGRRLPRQCRMQTGEQMEVEGLYFVRRPGAGQPTSTIKSPRRPAGGKNFSSRWADLDQNRSFRRTAMLMSPADFLIVARNPIVVRYPSRESSRRHARRNSRAGSIDSRRPSAKPPWCARPRTSAAAVWYAPMNRENLRAIHQRV